VGQADWLRRRCGFLALSLPFMRKGSGGLVLGDLRVSNLDVLGKIFGNPISVVGQKLNIHLRGRFSFARLRCDGTI